MDMTGDKHNPTDHGWKPRLVGDLANSPPPARRTPTGGTYQPDKLAYDIPDDLPPDPDFDQTDGGKLAKRLVIAFVLIVAAAVFNFVFLRRWEMDLHPIVLLGAFAIILIASIISAIQAQPEPIETDPDASCGCSVGCCSGPRPIGELSRKVARQRHNARPQLPDHPTS
ncbi:MAG TPA: hypothetical protein ENJ00_07910 [Phycisphaerales bacterium]|nr:hypothetical protein [Phycisphaerales bacterium]